ncbi:MCE family protein [Nocardia coubleae]|uniref:MCE family protein n=2 Tax=Nocardia coubleae TaxID=356147 RepID=A0A846VYK8_9NOCA|nr:MCE family protein [Nocardia coubleae]
MTRMPPYALPGTEVGPLRARVLGVCALLVALASVLAWQVWPESLAAEQIRVTLRTERVGAGIAPGTDVRLDGVRVGTVEAIAPAGRGREQLTLVLDRPQLFGLTDTVDVEFAPGNLFGISALNLVARPGGTELGNGSSVDLDDGRVRDATLAALLRSTGGLVEQVLTPKLAALLHTIAGDLRAFTPLLEALGATLRAYADTRELPPSELASSFGSVLAGMPPMLTGAVDVLEAAYTNEYLRSPANIARFGQFWGDMQYQLLPAVTALMTTARTHFGDMMPMATLLLDEVSATMGPTGRSADQLATLLERLGAAFRDTPDGPVLRVSVELDTVPGLAGPLAALLPSGGR